jgi:hypothetical protein
MDLITAVKDYALDHYNEGGWDVLVECYGDAEIEAELKEYDITTLPEALKHFAWRLGIHNEIREDIEGEAF